LIDIAITSTPSFTGQTALKLITSATTNHYTLYGPANRKFLFESNLELNRRLLFEFES